MALSVALPTCESENAIEQAAPATRIGIRSLLRQLAATNLFIAVMAMVALGLASLGERIVEGNGHGWDGTFYADLVQDFDRKIHEGLDSYRVPRILPSLILERVLRWTQIEPTDQAVVLAFVIFNVLLVGVTALLWTWVADELSISPGGKWLGATALFINFCILKHTAYYPVLTDVAGIALSMAMVYCYLTRRSLLLYAVSLMGMLTWPTLLVQGACLLLFPREQKPVLERRPPFRLNYILAMAVTAFISIVVMRYVSRHQNVRYFVPVPEVLGLSVGILSAYLFLALAPLCGCFAHWNFHKYLSTKNVLKTVLVLAALSAAVLCRHYLAAKPPSYEPKTYLKMISVISVLRPASFMLAHVVYFGPIVLLAIFHWRAICRQAHLLGQGYVTVLIWGVIQGIDGESRHLVASLPLLVAVVIKTIDARGWRAAQYVCIGVLSLLMSKVWLRINQGPFTGDAFSYPDQYYFMNHGHAMNSEMYLLQGAAVLMAAVVLYRFCVMPFRPRLQIAEQGESVALASA